MQIDEVVAPPLIGTTTLYAYRKAFDSLNHENGKFSWNLARLYIKYLLMAKDGVKRCNFITASLVRG